jgi:type VI secretion system protein VasD
MRFVFILLPLVLAFCLSACSSVMRVTDFALESVGLKKPEAPKLPELPEFQKPQRNVELKLHAGDNLNSGATDKPLSLIVRIYKLKQTGAFYSAPYDTFLSSEKEKQVLGADLLEVRELSLIPGQLYEVTEKVSRESNHIGIVTLFRSPAPQRWRAAFTAQEAEASGIIIGLHGCSLTLGKGARTDQTNIAALISSPSHCQ